MSLQYLTVEHLNTKELLRIFSQIEILDELAWNGTPCWIWCGSRVYDGYGRTQFQGVSEKIHRLIFAWAHQQPLPRKQQAVHLDHLCRRPACCNPLHLEIVPGRVNILRGNSNAAKNARKTHCKRGHLLGGENLFIEQGQRQCRTCSRWRNQEKAKRNPERIREHQRQYRLTHKDVIAAKRDANREIINARAREAYRRKQESAAVPLLHVL